MTTMAGRGCGARSLLSGGSSGHLATVFARAQGGSAVEIDTKSAESLVDKLAALELTDDEATMLALVLQRATGDEVEGFLHKQYANQEQIAKFVVTLYVEQMKLKLND